MYTTNFYRPLIALVLTALLMGTPAHGLVNINDGKNQLFVVATASFAWDSNIFASRAGQSDFISSGSLGLEFQRRAGIIGINGSVGIALSHFGEFSSEDFANPSMRAEFTKQSGRTTGSLTLGASRQSRADSAANIRTESWNYDLGVNLKYPVIERYSLSGGVNYTLLDYIDNSFLVDLRTYAANLDLFYVYTSERDLIAGYRIRHGETSADTSFYDHALTVGVSGKILPKISGNARFGYQIRQPHGNTTEGDYQSWTATVGATWAASKKLNVSMQLSKDFSTTSTNINTDTTSLNLDASYAIRSKLAIFGGVGYGYNDFLGTPGAGRKDEFFSWNAGARYTLNSHFSATLTYSFYQNWSTLDFADFTRNSVSLNLSSKF